MDPLQRIGEFSEQGRGLPIGGSRPGGALPFSPIVSQAYAPTPRARLGWGQGEITVADVRLEPAEPLARTDSPKLAARRLGEQAAGWIPILDGDRFLGVVFAETLLSRLADDLLPPDVQPLLSTQIPTCAPFSALVDAVRQMIACYLRSLPVVGERGQWRGRLLLSTAARAAERDPAVRDVLEGAADPSSLFARPWR
jgi:hypothetical protein